MRVNWTDDRLDALSGRVDERFDRVDERFRQVDERFKQVDHRFDRVEADVREIRIGMKAGFDGLNRTLMLVGGGIIAALTAALVTALVALIAA